MQNVIITYQTGQIVVASFPGTEEKEHMVYTVRACACAKTIYGRIMGVYRLPY